MEKLNELIAELCPHGVPYYPISELGTLTRGKRFVHADAVDEGIPCIHYGELYTYYGIATEKTKSFVRRDLAGSLRYAKKNDVIIVGAGENDIDIGIAVAYTGDDSVAVHDACYIFTQDNDPKYISYCLRTNAYHAQIKKYVSTGKICAISAEGIGKAIIPIPPLEVQHEIVKVLDNYTLLTDKLSEELAKEANAQNKKYAFFRDKVFNIVDRYERKTIKDVCVSICSGGTPNSKTSEYYGGSIPWLRTQEVNFGKIERTELSITEEGLKNSSAKWIPANSVIVAMYGATVGKVAYTAIPLTTNQACCNLIIDENIALYKYVYYWLASRYELIKSLGQGSQTNINAQIVKDLEIIVPPLNIQKMIVDLMEDLDEKSSGLGYELQAEIGARKKQYEYYRDKLLAFKEN